MSDWLTQTLAIMGAVGSVLSAGLLFWEIWKYRHERREKVIPKLRVEEKTEDGRTSYNLVVNVYNAGRVEVFIKGVTLFWHSNGTLNQKLFQVPIYQHPLPKPGMATKVIVQLMGRTSTEKPLAVGDCEDFYFGAFEPGQPKSLFDLPPKDIWITVNAGSGEVAKIKGSKVIQMLRKAGGLTT